MSNSTSTPTTAAATSGPSSSSKPSQTKTYDPTKPIITLANGISVRTCRHSDAKSLAHHGNNYKIARNMQLQWPHPYTLEDAHDWIARCRNQSDWGHTGPTDPKSNNTAGSGPKMPRSWTVTIDDVAIGSVGIQFRDDVSARSLTFGYWLGEDYWRQGIMGQVVPAFVHWIWETYPWVVRLEAWVFGWNPASAKLLEKCGFAREGTMRCAIERFGVIGDMFYYGMVREGVYASEDAPVEKT